MITLKNIKHSAFASQETHCYEATVYFNGKKAGIVGNQGHGGCDDEHRTDPEVWAAMEAYIKTLPMRKPDWLDEEDHEGFPASLEVICGGLVNEWLVTKDLKRLLKSRVVFIRDGKTFQTNKAPNAAALAKWVAEYDAKKDCITLNSLPLANAIKLFGGK